MGILRGRYLNTSFFFLLLLSLSLRRIKKFLVPLGVLTIFLLCLLTFSRNWHRSIFLFMVLSINAYSHCLYWFVSFDTYYFYGCNFVHIATQIINTAYLLPFLYNPSHLTSTQREFKSLGIQCTQFIRKVFLFYLRFMCFFSFVSCRFSHFAFEENIFGGPNIVHFFIYIFLRIE